MNVSTYFIEAHQLVERTLTGRVAFRATAALVAQRLGWLEPGYEQLFGTPGLEDDAGAPSAATPGA